MIFNITRKHVFLNILLLNTVTCYGSFESSIFEYDDLTQAQGLNARIESQNWHIENVKETDTNFYCELFDNPNIMRQFANGQTVDAKDVHGKVNRSIDKFAQGYPHGHMTGIDNNFQSFMLIIASGGGRPGTSELSYIVHEKFWNKGLAKNVTKAMVDTWAPEVRRIGRGEGFDAIKYAPIAKKFCCFSGEALNRFIATASPANVASCKVLIGSNFEADREGLIVCPQDINFDGREFDGNNPGASIRTELMKLFDIGTATEPLVAGKRYSMVDNNGIICTFSKHIAYNDIRYHYSKKVE